MAKRIKGSNVQAVITDGKVTGLAVNGQDIGVVTAKTSEQGVGKTRRSVGSRQHVGKLISSATPVDDNFSHQIQWDLPTAFDAVQFRFRNNEATAVTLRAICSPTSKSVSGQALFYDAAGAAYTTDVQDVTVGGSTSIVIPARLAAGKPSYLLSDVIPMKSVQRSDGGIYPCAAVRALPAALATFPVSQNNHTGYRNGGMLTTRVVRMAGDFVTTNLNGFTSASSAVTDFFCEIIYYARGQAVTVASIGDSLTEGIYSEDTIGYIEKTCWQLLQDGIPVTYSNHGWHAQTSVQSFPRLVDLLAQDILPDVLVYAPYSINDPTPTQAGINGMLMRAQQAINLCRKKGVGIVLTTGIPSNNNFETMGAADAFRVAFNESLIALGSALDVPVADLSTPLSGVVLGGQVQLLAGCAVSDGGHLTNVGNGIARDALYPVLKAAIQNTTIRSSVAP